MAVLTTSGNNTRNVEHSHRNLLLTVVDCGCDASNPRHNLPGQNPPNKMPQITEIDNKEAAVERNGNKEVVGWLSLQQTSRLIRPSFLLVVQ